MKEKIIKILEEKAECTINGHADFDNVDVTQFEGIAEEIVKLCNLHFASNNEERVVVGCHTCKHNPHAPFVPKMDKQTIEEQTQNAIKNEDYELAEKIKSKLS